MHYDAPQVNVYGQLDRRIYQVVLADLYILFSPSQPPGGLQWLPPHVSQLSHNIIRIVKLHFHHSFYPIPCEPGTEQVHHMIHTGCKSRPHGLGCHVRACTLLKNEEYKWC